LFDGFGLGLRLVRRRISDGQGKFLFYVGKIAQIPMKFDKFAKIPEV